MPCFFHDDHIEHSPNRRGKLERSKMGQREEKRGGGKETTLMGTGDGRARAARRVPTSDVLLW